MQFEKFGPKPVVSLKQNKTILSRSKFVSKTYSNNLYLFHVHNKKK